MVMPDTPNELAFFWFSEAMAHRTLLGAMSPLDRFTVLPYLLDPFQDTGMWRLNQQQAQNDAMESLQLTTIPAAQNLYDTDFSNPAQAAWFTFVNHLELYVATAQLPSPLKPAW